MPQLIKTACRCKFYSVFYLWFLMTIIAGDDYFIAVTDMGTNAITDDADCCIEIYFVAEDDGYSYASVTAEF